ncbi:MAG: hypothetical protein ACOCXG_01195 [Nanoarchaeota archaeon]
MLWQDVIITLANVLFMVSLANQVLYGFKHKKISITLFTSALTAIGLFAMGTAFLSLNLILSPIVAYLSGLLWTILFIQRIIYK